MKKKLLIVVCALMMMFGTTLSVSAEETTTSNIKTTHYLYVKDDGAKFSTMYYNVPVKVLSLKVSDCTLHYFISNIPFQYASCGGAYDESMTLEENIANFERYFFEVYTCNEESVNSYFNIGENDYFFKTIVFHDDNSDITECNYSYLSYNLSDSISFGESSAKDILYNFLLENSDILGDWYDVMTEDDTFGLTGFTADNTITASWTGTTHDDVIDTYNQADVGIRPWYYYKSAPEMMAFKDMVLEEYEIADKTFTKLYDELTYSDDTLFLRYLEVIPTYQKVALGQAYKGKSCWIEFDEDGNVVNIINDIHEEYPEEFYDSSFSLTDVDMYKKASAVITGEVVYDISWTGSTKDDVIKTIDLDKTYVSILYKGALEDGSIKFFDYEDILESELGSDCEVACRIHANNNYTGNYIPFNVDKTVNVCETDAYTFMGEVWLTPYYTVNNCIYKGKVTVVNVLTGQVGTIDPENPDEPVYPEDPEEPETGEEEPEIPEIEDLDDIFDVIPWFIKVIKYFFDGVGQVPAFFNVLFPYLPSGIVSMFSLSFIVLLILRILGR